MFKEIRRTTIIVLTIIILLTMFAGCSKPEEKFAKQSSMITMTTTEIWYIIRNKSMVLLEEQSYNIEDAFVDAYYEEAEPVIKLNVLISDDNNGKKEIKEFKVKTQYDDAIVSALLIGESKYWIEDHYLYIADYLRETEYNLVGDQIILVESLY